MEDEKSKALEERQSSPCALGLRLGRCTPVARIGIGRFLSARNESQGPTCWKPGIDLRLQHHRLRALSVAGSKKIKASRRLRPRSEGVRWHDRDDTDYRQLFLDRPPGQMPSAFPFSIARLK